MHSYILCYFLSVYIVSSATVLALIWKTFGLFLKISFKYLSNTLSFLPFSPYYKYRFRKTHSCSFSGFGFINKVYEIKTSKSRPFLDFLCLRTAESQVFLYPSLFIFVPTRGSYWALAGSNQQDNRKIKINICCILVFGHWVNQVSEALKGAVWCILASYKAFMANSKLLVDNQIWGAAVLHHQFSCTVCRHRSERKQTSKLDYSNDHLTSCSALHCSPELCCSSLMSYH